MFDNDLIGGKEAFHQAEVLDQGNGIIDTVLIGKIFLHYKQTHGLQNNLKKYYNKN